MTADAIRSPMAIGRRAALGGTVNVRNQLGRLTR
jgi:hypothetical protein